MADYLLIPHDEPDQMSQVEAPSLAKALEELDWVDGAVITVYRVLAPPRIVKVKTISATHFEIT